MKILHILKKEPDPSTKKIIELHKAGNTVTVVDLSKGGFSYESLVADTFSHDKVFCW